ncbi:MAG: cation diffusion facilitator family transporter [candidate division Zixibacteria bacterium]|nr:cation diffusion facilitator family transporter [candidate division Zixibacteria bacterium]
MGRHHDHRHNHGARRLGWTILLNVGITAAEVVGGVVSGSLALLSDAGHNFSDVIALVLAYFGAWGSNLPPTKRSTYGFKRLEVVTAFINALTLVAIALFITYEALNRYSHPVPIHAPVMLIVATIGLLGNLLSVWMLSHDRNRTINTRAAYLHMLYDAVSSVAVIIGGVIILFSGWYLLDLILSVVIAMMILWSGLDVLKEAGGIFMESVPRGIDIDEVSRSILAVPGVADVHHLHIWSISSDQTALSCHIALTESKTDDFPSVIRAIHAMLKDKHGIEHATIQPEGDLCPEQPLISPSTISDTEHHDAADH